MLGRARDDEVHELRKTICRLDDLRNEALSREKALIEQVGRLKLRIKDLETELSCKPGWRNRRATKE